jgi:hypothetical protein
MNIGFVWLKINDFPNIPVFQHSIIPINLKGGKEDGKEDFDC